MNKRVIYISLFTLLGIILSFLAHALLEIPIINLLVKDFERYGLGLTWQQWYVIHQVGSIFLLILGIIVGFTQGKYWWRIIYIDKKYRCRGNKNWGKII
jgi:hypothetical protein